MCVFSPGHVFCSVQGREQKNNESMRRKSDDDCQMSHGPGGYECALSSLNVNRRRTLSWKENAEEVVNRCSHVGLTMVVDDIFLMD